MELMDQLQITIMFERLSVESVIREALTERGTSCGLAPFSVSQEQVQEEEVVYSTSCSFLMDDETLFKGCSVLEQIIQSYDSEVVSVFFDQGTCSDFTTKYHEIAFQELEIEQMQVVFQNLGVGSGVQSIIVSRAVACNLKPFAQANQDQEINNDNNLSDDEPDNNDQEPESQRQENIDGEPTTLIPQQPETVYPAKPPSDLANETDDEIITMTKAEWLEIWE